MSHQTETQRSNTILMAWSVGSAQVTYPIVGSWTLILGFYHSARIFWDRYRRSRSGGDGGTDDGGDGRRYDRDAGDTFKRAWMPFIASTMCLVPFLGALAVTRLFGPLSLQGAPSKLARIGYIGWSLGSSQVTFVVVGPIALAYAVANTFRILAGRTRDDPFMSLSAAWTPLALATMCLVPVVGPLLAVHCFEPVAAM